MNFPRTLLGTNCHVSGTGFLVSAKVIEENGGWPFHLLTEDIQFSVDCAIRGRKIGYCDKAVIYDEQPTTFQQSWDQRLRWSKGFYQVDRAYTLPLLKGCLRKGRLGTSCYDMFVTVAPGMLLTLAMILFNASILLACLTQPVYLAAWIVEETVRFMISAVVNFYVGLLIYGLLTVLSEWKHVDARSGEEAGVCVYLPHLHVHLHPHLYCRPGAEGGVEAHLPHRRQEDQGNGLRAAPWNNIKTAAPSGAACLFFRGTDEDAGIFRPDAVQAGQARLFAEDMAPERLPPPPPGPSGRTGRSWPGRSTGWR